MNYALAFYIYKDLVEFSDMSDDDFWLMTKMDALVKVQMERLGSILFRNWP